MSDQPIQQKSRKRPFDDAHESDRFRTFGRAKGRSLTAAQNEVMDTHWRGLQIAPGEVLPRATSNTPVWLEIGFGMGSHVLHLARTRPDVSIIGADPFLNGTAKVVRGIVDEELDNLKLFRGDVRELLDGMPEGALDRVYILFPDPWPKARHNKRRLIRTAFIEQLYSRMGEGSELWFASDIPHYTDWALTRFRAHARRLTLNGMGGGFVWDGADPSQPPENWPGTKFEAKARREGRTPLWFRLARH